MTKRKSRDNCVPQGDEASLQVQEKYPLNKEWAKMLEQVKFQVPPNCF